VNNVQTIAPSVDSQDSSNQARTIVEDKFEFNRAQSEVTVNSTTKIIEREFKEENSELKFENYVSFPQFDGVIAPSQTKFNNAVRQRASKEFESYGKRQLRPLGKAQRFPRYHEDVVEHLYVDYDIPLITDKLVSVRFYASTYGRGAAHDVEYFFVFNYDLKSGRELQLADLFLPNIRYLNVLSDYSREVVKEKICREGGWAGTQPFEDCLKNAPLWEEGIKPSHKNFKAWTIIKEGLLLSFDPCQLTGCASGEFYVVVPYSKIKNLSRPNGVIPRA
jgi:hypothetical protein